MKSYLSIIVCILIFVQIPAHSQTTITLRPGPEEGIDANLHSRNPDNNYAEHPDFMPVAWTNQGDPVTVRSLIDFNLSEIPDGSIITNASLSLYANLTTWQSMNHSQLSGSNEAFLRRIISPWKEYDVTWNKQPFTTSKNQVWLHPSNYATEDYLDIDVTALIKDIFGNPENSYGMMIILKTEIYYRSLVFSSSDHDNPEFWPKLVITYDECGLPSAGFSYTQQEHMVNFFAVDTAVSSCFWDFGDGYYSSLLNPVHDYKEMGNYLVCLEAENDCGNAVFCDTIRVCDVPEVSFSYELVGRTAIFSNQSLNSDEYFWDMGTGFFTGLENPVYTFEENGSYLICLRGTNECAENVFCDSLYVEAYQDLRDQDKNEQIKIYPNPFINFFTVKLADNNFGEIIIYDMTGRIRHRELFTNTDHLKINGSVLESGMYVLKLSSGKWHTHYLLSKQE